MIKRTFALEILCFFGFLYLYCFYLKRNQIIPWLPLMIKLDYMVVSTFRFEEAMFRYKRRRGKTALRRLYNIFAFLRDYYLLMFFWYIVEQLIPIGLGDASFQDLNIDFLRKNLIIELTSDLVIIWVVYMLGLKDVFDLILLNIVGYLRIKDSMRLYSKKKREYSVDSKNLGWKYFDHFLRNGLHG